MIGDEQMPTWYSGTLHITRGDLRPRDGKLSHLPSGPRSKSRDVRSAEHPRTSRPPSLTKNDRQVPIYRCTSCKEKVWMQGRLNQRPLHSLIRYEVACWPTAFGLTQRSYIALPCDSPTTAWLPAKPQSASAANAAVMWADALSRKPGHAGALADGATRRRATSATPGWSGSPARCRMTSAHCERGSWIIPHFVMRLRPPSPGGLAQ